MHEETKCFEPIYLFKTISRMSVVIVEKMPLITKTWPEISGRCYIIWSNGDFEYDTLWMYLFLLFVDDIWLES